jgi:hypothetical protein
MRIHNFNILLFFLFILKVLDSLVWLTCRSDVSSEVRWLGVWLVRQLLPHAGEEFTSSHLSQLKVQTALVPCFFPCLEGALQFHRGINQSLISYSHLFVSNSVCSSVFFYK